MKRNRAILLNREANYSYEDAKRALRLMGLPVIPFRKWLCGQTCPLVGGKIGVYGYDLGRYLDWKRRGDKPLWD